MEQRHAKAETAGIGWEGLGPGANAQWGWLLRDSGCSGQHWRDLQFLVVSLGEYTLGRPQCAYHEEPRHKQCWVSEPSVWEHSVGACKEQGPSSSKELRRSPSLKERGEGASWAQRCGQKGAGGSFARTGAHGGNKGAEHDARTGQLQGGLEVQL